MAFNVNHLLGDPMANAAMAYGSSIATHGKDMVHKEVWPFPRARVAGFVARAGHHGIHLIRTAALREGAHREAPDVWGAACPQPPFSPPSCTVLCP